MSLEFFRLQNIGVKAKLIARLLCYDIQNSLDVS